MAYERVPPSMRDALGLLDPGAITVAGARVGLLSAPERRFLARTARQWKWGDENTLCILGALLRDTSCDVRSEAHRSLIRCTELHGEPLLSELEACLEQEPWVQISRVLLLQRLAGIDVCRVLALLCPAAASGITWVEGEVTKCLSTCWFLDREGTWHGIEDWLRHRSAHVREIAVRFVSSGHWPNGSNVPSVLQSVTEDPSSLVRTLCARGISLWAWDDLDLAIPALRALSRDRSHRNIRLAVVRGVTHWRKAAPYEALDILFPLLRDVACSVRRLAFRQLNALRREFANLTVDVLSDGRSEPRNSEALTGARSRSYQRATERRRIARGMRQVRE
jgi:hypothetical protein